MIDRNELAELSVEDLFADALADATSIACGGPSATFESCVLGLRSGLGAIGELESSHNITVSTRTNTTVESGFVEFRNSTGIGSSTEIYSLRIAGESVTNGTDPFAQGSTLHQELGVSYSFERLNEEGNVIVEYG